MQIIMVVLGALKWIGIGFLHFMGRLFGRKVEAAASEAVEDVKEESGLDDPVPEDQKKLGSELVVVLSEGESFISKLWKRGNLMATCPCCGKLGLVHVWAMIYHLSDTLPGEWCYPDVWIHVVDRRQMVPTG